MNEPINLEHDFLNSSEVANLLNISLRTLHRWGRLRKGPPSIKVGRRIYYRRAAIEQWLLALEGTTNRDATVARIKP